MINLSASLMGLFLLLSGCAVTPPRVDPYSSLLPAGTKVVDDKKAQSTANIKNEEAFFVLGANFYNFEEAWYKIRKSLDGVSGAMFSASSGISREEVIEITEQWSPQRVATLVSNGLRPHFKKITKVDSLGEAKAQNARWIIVFDHAFVQTSSATATWTNTTNIDLLDNGFKRVVAASFTERMAHGIAMNNNDQKRLMKLRGVDLARSVESALTDFNTKLVASR